jgi:hypothetical protein
VVAAEVSWGTATEARLGRLLFLSSLRELRGPVGGAKGLAPAREPLILKPWSSALEVGSSRRERREEE